MKNHEITQIDQSTADFLGLSRIFTDFRSSTYGIGFEDSCVVCYTHSPFEGWQEIGSCPEGDFEIWCDGDWLLYAWDKNPSDWDLEEDIDTSLIDCKIFAFCGGFHLQIFKGNEEHGERVPLEIRDLGIGIPSWGESV